MALLGKLLQSGAAVGSLAQAQGVLVKPLQGGASAAVVTAAPVLRVASLGGSPATTTNVSAQASKGARLAGLSAATAQSSGSSAVVKPFDASATTTSLTQSVLSRDAWIAGDASTGSAVGGEARKTARAAGVGAAGATSLGTAISFKSLAAPALVLAAVNGRLVSTYLVDIESFGATSVEVFESFGATSVEVFVSDAAIREAA